jgi:hypothetical protein
MVNRLLGLITERTSLQVARSAIQHRLWNTNHMKNLQHGGAQLLQSFARNQIKLNGSKKMQHRPIYCYIRQAV